MSRAMLFCCSLTVKEHLRFRLYRKNKGLKTDVKKILKFFKKVLRKTLGFEEKYDLIILENVSYPTFQFWKVRR